MDEQDEDGRTCLSYGASIGYYKGLCNILNRSTKGVYVCDQDGSFPIHSAAKNEHYEIIKEFIKRCPASKYLLNRLGQNILHVAAKNEASLTAYMLMHDKDTKHLGVGQDVDGNTPLHLAVMNWDFDSITCLASRNHEILKLRNKSGLRARDIAESEVKPNYIFHEVFLIPFHTTHLIPHK
jgi:ankyrin repeat protein